MLNLQIEGDTRLSHQLQALSFPAQKRRLYHQKIGREVLRKSKRRIVQQKTVSGEKFQPRTVHTPKKAHQKSKMLKHLMRSRQGQNLMRLNAGPHRGTLTWSNTLIGKVAQAQQSGVSEVMTANKMRRQSWSIDYQAPATRVQAKALIQAGFRRRKKRVSQKWIRENMLMGQAGLILRILRDDPAQSSWVIKTPARPFFGLNRSEASELADLFLEEVKQSIRY